MPTSAPKATPLSNEAMDAVFFDLDGTLTDPKIGITRSIQYAIGNPSNSNNTETARANCSVSQNVCQSMAMRLVT